MKKKYEAMFVLDNRFAGKEWESVEAELRAILGRFGAAVETVTKWAERRLAYEIHKQKRATFVNAIFDVDAAQVAALRDHCKLDERILRFLVLRYNPNAQTHLPSDALFSTRPGEAPEEEHKYRGDVEPQVERDTPATGEAGREQALIEDRGTGAGGQARRSDSCGEGG